MKMVFRLLTACLAACLTVCLMTPGGVRAGGDKGTDPYEVGERYFSRKDYKIALGYYQKALRRKDPRAHYRLGNVYEATGRDRDALSHYRRFLALGQPEGQQGDAAQRAGAVEERLRQKKKTTPTAGPFERGKSLFLKKNFRGAERALLEAAAKDASRPEIYFYLGEVYLALEEYDKAKAAYVRAKGYY